MGHRSHVRVGCVLTALVLLAACGSTGAQAPAAKPSAATPGSSATAASAAPLPIKIAYQPDADAPLYLAENLHLFSKAGLAVKLLKFESGPPMFAAIKAGSADVAAEGTGPIVTGPVRGIPQIGVMVAHDDSGVSGLVARNGSGIRSVAQLKGKTVGAERGSGTYFALLQALAKDHMTIKDIQFKNLQPPAMLAAFKSGQIQAAWVWAPWAQDMAAAGGRVVTTNAKQGIYQPVVWAANTAWASKHTPTLLKFIGVMDQAARYATAHPNQAAKALSPVMHVDLQVARLIEQNDGYPTVKQQLDPHSQYSFVGGYQACDAAFALSTVDVAKQLVAQHQIKTVPSCHELFTPKYLQAYEHAQ